jgi:hypothetical protein
MSRSVAVFHHISSWRGQGTFTFNYHIERTFCELPGRYEWQEVSQIEVYLFPNACPLKFM